MFDYNKQTSNVLVTFHYYSKISENNLKEERRIFKGLSPCSSGLTTFIWCQIFKKDVGEG